MTTEDPPSAERFSLSRWSRRKHEAARTARQETPEAGAVAAVPPAISAPEQANGATTATDAPPAAPLPPVETLTFDSDFAPFVQPKVDEPTKRAALKKLFADPRFNAMDGLDVYVDDYTQADPMPAGMLDKLARAYDAIVGHDEAAAVKEGEGGAPAAPAVVQRSAPAQSAAAPAQLTDETAPAPLAPTLSPQAGRGGDKDASS